ncbi:adenosylmethionine decarboxylase [Lentisphaerota bacterium ZTH]|nr:adenosylmethionine decarboxylase [Lentisphaerota bacterium]WET07743.1 adenosylmethionine decarboxylase [Lentisphaerota bacterium ZTH]
MTIEYYDCDAELLADSVRMENVFIEAAKASGATVLGTNFHAFEPQGVSGFVVIAESHFSVHAWPEHDYAAVDIFTCGDSIDFEKAVDTLREGMKAGNVIISGVMNRGIISNNGIERMVPVYEDRTHMYALSWEKRFKDTSAWGLLASVDVYNCDPELIRNADSIKMFARELCEKIEMQRYGDCEVVHFGADKRIAGFSMTQLLETSLLSGHFANESNTAYLDIFSCKYYDPREVAEYAISFFKGDHYRLQVALRR